MRIPEFRDTIQARPGAIKRRGLDEGTDAYIDFNFVSKEELEELQKDLADALVEQSNLLLEILKQSTLAAKNLNAMSDEDIDEEDVEVNN